MFVTFLLLFIRSPKVHWVFVTTSLVLVVSYGSQIYVASSLSHMWSEVLVRHSGGENTWSGGMLLMVAPLMLSCDLIMKIIYFYIKARIAANFAFDREFFTLPHYQLE